MWNKKYCRLEKIHFFNPQNGLLWLHLFVQNLRKNKCSTQRQCYIGYELYSCVFSKSWHDLPVSVFICDEGFHMKSQPGELHQWETGEFFCALCWHILSQSPLWTRSSFPTSRYSDFSDVNTHSLPQEVAAAAGYHFLELLHLRCVADVVHLVVVQSVVDIQRCTRCSDQHNWAYFYATSVPVP